MSDKLSDEQIRQLADDTDSGRTASGKRLFSDRNLLAFARAILAASPAPATPACQCDMRTMLVGDGCDICNPTREFATMQPEDAPAIPAVDPVSMPRDLLEALIDDVEQFAGRSSFRAHEEQARAESIASARAILAAPAISESDVLRNRAVTAEARLEHAITILTRIHSFLLTNDVRLPDGRVFEFSNPAIEHEMLRGLCAAIRAVPDEIAAIDAARAGGKS